jgi:hypothetical protein
MNRRAIAILLFLLIASLGTLFHSVSGDNDSDLQVLPLTQHLVVDLVYTDMARFNFNMTNSGTQPRSIQIQHQSTPDWGERIDYQFTVQPGGIDTVWVNMVYNPPSSDFNGTTYTATYGVIAWHVNPPFGDYVAANVTITWTVITSWNWRFLRGNGKVLDANTSAPIPGAYVGFGMHGEFGNPGYPIVSQADGNYSAERMFAGIPNTAIAMTPGYQTYVNADYYLPEDSQEPVQQNFELIPSETIGNYSLEWNSTLLSPIYYGAISSDFKTVILAGGEHGTASYHASASPSFSNLYYTYMFDMNGTMLWRFGPVTNSSDPHDSSDIYGGFWTAAITADGSLAAAGTTNGELFVFDRHGLLWNVNATGPNGASAFAKFSPDGECLVDTAFRGTIEYRNATTGAILWTANTDEYADPRATLFSADGSRLLVGTSFLRMFDTANGELLWARVTNGFIWPTAIAATPDFSFIVVGTGKGGSIWAYDGNGNFKWEFDTTSTAVNWVSMSSDGSVIAVGARDGLRVFSPDGKLRWGICGLATILPWLGDVTAGAVTPDGHYILAGTDGSTVYVNDFPVTPNGALLFDVNGTLLWRDFWNTTATKWSPLDFGKPSFAAISSDASNLVFGSTDNILRIYHGAIVASPSYQGINHVIDNSVQVDGQFFHVVTETNSTVSDTVLDQSQIEFNASGDPGAVGYFNVTIPKSLMNCTQLDDWVVWVNGTQLLPPDFPTPTENATHTSIYFTCTFASTLQVTIKGTHVVPEFSSPIILLLSIAATLLAIIVCKRRNGKLSINTMKNGQYTFVTNHQPIFQLSGQSSEPKR